MEEESSYITTVKKKQDQSVSFTQWRRDVDHLERVQEESDH
jgi:hypothetical protein